MSDAEILLLGAIAGLTIFIGLPIARIRAMPTSIRALLNATAAGVLVFLLIETFEHSFEPVEEAVKDSEWGTFVGRGLLFIACVGIGLVGLVYYDRRLKRRGEELHFGPGAASTSELSFVRRVHRLNEGHRLALLIAFGIGLHNFSEGLAIGQSAAQDKISLAVLLIIGFGLHNTTEAFGIVGPLAAEGQRPTWGFLATCGLIGGGPTFFGTLIGQSYVSEWLSISFLALAAGSILYVIVELIGVAFKLGHKEMLMWGLLLGIVLGFGTELALVAAGV